MESSKIKEITDWADAILVSDAASDYLFIEISTAASTYDLIKILENIQSMKIRKWCAGLFYELFILSK